MKKERMRRTAFPYLPLILSFGALSAAVFFSLQALTTDSLAYRFDFVSYGGTFRYPEIRLGSLKISLYWTFQILGIGGMCLLLSRKREEIGIPVWKAVVTGVLLAVFGFVGAKLLFILENFESVLRDGITLGGVSFFGTVFFMPAAIPLIALLLRIPQKGFMDFCTPAGVLMLAVIRIGCFSNGCCEGIRIMAGMRPWVIPAQLIEASLDFSLLAVLLLPRIKARFEGVLYALFMGAYGLIRFAVEFIRNTPKDVLGLSNGQWFSLAALLSSAVVLFISWARKNKDQKGKKR